MADQNSIKDRLYAFLETQEQGVSAETLATEVLGLRGARGAVAEKIVQAAVENDARFRHVDGRWTLKPVGRGKALQQIAFVCFGVIEEAERIELAARRVGMQGRETLFPAVQIGADGEGCDALRSFAAFAEGAVPVAFRLPRRRSAVNRLGRYLLGQPVLADGICLHRLGRRAFPELPLSDLEALARAMALTFVADRGAEGEASLQVEVLLRLLTRCEGLGLTTVEAVTADLYPDPVPVRFESYAFDEAFLRELPESPGVYIMRDRAGCVIYVGKAVNLRRRVGSYFARRSARPEKTRRILERIWSMEVETVGSELEALLLEARLIALCRPEFNTQVDVHARDAHLGPLKNWALVLPSAEVDCVEVFCAVADGALTQVRVRQDLRDWDAASERLRGLYFSGTAQSGTLSEPESAEWQIAHSWLGAKRETVNVIDIDALGAPDDALRILSEYVQQCEAEDWEKVAWRV